MKVVVVIIFVGVAKKDTFLLLNGLKTARPKSKETTVKRQGEDVANNEDDFN